MNQLSELMAKILSRSLTQFRYCMIAPRLVNSVNSHENFEKDEPVWVPFSEEIPTLARGRANGSNVFLDQWRQTMPVSLSQAEEGKILNSEDSEQGFLPMQLVESVRVMANTMNSHIYSKYTGVYNFISKPSAGIGTICDPFGTGDTNTSGVSAATIARKILNDHRCPRGNRRGILSFNAESALGDLGPASESEKVGIDDAPINNEIGRKFGINWVSDDYIPVHTAGSSYNQVGNVTLNNDELAGSTRISILGTKSGTLVAGDIFTIDGDKQTYCVTGASASYTLHPTNRVVVSIVPALKVTQRGGGQKITIVNSHTVNLVFHKDAISFASGVRAIEEKEEKDRCVMTMTDPVTGLTLRLEAKLSKQQATYTLDTLYGATLAKPEYCVRVAGAV